MLPVLQCRPQLVVFGRESLANADCCQPRVTGTASERGRVTKSHDSLAPRSGMHSVARPWVDVEGLLDELALRLLPMFDFTERLSAVGRGQMLPRPQEGQWRGAYETVRSWWSDHALGQARYEVLRELCEVLLTREPLTYRFAAGALLAGPLADLLTTDYVNRVVAWYARRELTRSERDALTLLVVVPWLERTDVSLAIATLRGWARDSSPTLARVAFASLAGAARRESPPNYVQHVEVHELLRLGLGVRDTEVSGALGWALRELLAAGCDSIPDWLLAHSAELPRLTLRTALERAPGPLRRQLVAKWRETHPSRERQRGELDGLAGER